MKSSADLLAQLVEWAEKREIDLEKWIMTIRLEGHIRNGIREDQPKIFGNPVVIDPTARH